ALLQTHVRPNVQSLSPPVIATFQRKRLIAEHRLDDDASVAGVERVFVDEVAAFRDDPVGILHDLELLEAILRAQTRSPRAASKETSFDCITASSSQCGRNHPRPR
ncbi:MAG TPA: hypothetical protein VFH41_05205, partial [Bradyrhizobium sp.]|nr:hypothetical protein [Bradyrhizobium sp.]